MTLITGRSARGRPAGAVGGSVAGAQAGAAGGGEDAQDAQGGRIAAAVAAHLEITSPDVEVVTYDGGGSAYLLMIGVE